LLVIHNSNLPSWKNIFGRKCCAIIYACYPIVCGIGSRLMELPCSCLLPNRVIKLCRTNRLYHNMSVINSSTSHEPGANIIVNVTHCKIHTFFYALQRVIFVLLC
jgi:hypothetical protein